MQRPSTSAWGSVFHDCSTHAPRSGALLYTVLYKYSRYFWFALFELHRIPLCCIVLLARIINTLVNEISLYQEGLDVESARDGTGFDS